MYVCASFEFAMQLPASPSPTKKFTSKDLESPNRRTLEDTTRAFCYNKEKRISNLPRLSGLGFGSSRLGLLTLVLRSRGGLLLGLVLLGATLGLVAVRRSPQGQVVTQKLHDQGAVTVALFGEGVELSNGVIERLLGKVASTVGRVQNLVVENGEVEGESETDGVGRGEFGLSDIGGVLINLVSIALF